MTHLFIDKPNDCEKNVPFLTMLYTITTPSSLFSHFRSLFHHEDEGNYSLLSYEARVYHFDVTGAKQGSAQKCVKCPAGEYLTKSGAFCLKCPVGKYSTEGSTKCLECPENTFSDKEGSGKCTKCGTGTTACRFDLRIMAFQDAE